VDCQPLSVENYIRVTTRSRGTLRTTRGKRNAFRQIAATFVCALVRAAGTDCVGVFDESRQRRRPPRAPLLHAPVMPAQPPAECIGDAPRRRGYAGMTGASTGSENCGVFPQTTTSWVFAATLIPYV
jgi:hypothetical protein